jgi:tetratricopeptide (TPR) repeat protein
VEAYHLVEWLELILAQTDQFFSLEDSASHIQAIERIVTTFRYTDVEQNAEIAKFLHELSHKHASIQISADALQTIKLLLQYIEADARSDDRLNASTALLERIKQLPSISPDALVQIYSDRGWAYLHLKEHEKAISDFNSALTLNPEYAWAYGSRGLVFRVLKKFKQAITDFDRAIELNPEYAWAYGSRGVTYHLLKEYRRAIEDFDHAIELKPQYTWAYVHRGITYRMLQDFQRALDDFDLSLKLEPRNAVIFAQRGLTSLWMRNYRQAAIDYARGWELHPLYLHNGWMSAWTHMCQSTPDLRMAEGLEMIASRDTEAYTSFVCRSVALWLRQEYHESLVLLEQAIQVGPDGLRWISYFWKGMIYASMGRDEEAKEAIERSLELELPPILLIPLRWFEQDRPDFYQRYIVPLMARYDLG